MPTEITFANDAASLPALPVGVADAIGAAIASASDAASSAEAALASQNIAKYHADSAAASAAGAATESDNGLMPYADKKYMNGLTSGKVLIWSFKEYCFKNGVTLSSSYDAGPLVTQFLTEAINALAQVIDFGDQIIYLATPVVLRFGQNGLTQWINVYQRAGIQITGGKFVWNGAASTAYMIDLGTNVSVVSTAAMGNMRWTHGRFYGANLINTMRVFNFYNWQFDLCEWRDFGNKIGIFLPSTDDSGNYTDDNGASFYNCRWSCMPSSSNFTGPPIKAYCGDIVVNGGYSEWAGPHDYHIGSIWIRGHHWSYGAGSPTTMRTAAIFRDAREIQILSCDLDTGNFLFTNQGWMDGFTFTSGTPTHNADKAFTAITLIGNECFTNVLPVAGRGALATFEAGAADTYTLGVTVSGNALATVGADDQAPDIAFTTTGAGTWTNVNLLHDNPKGYGFYTGNGGTSAAASYDGNSNTVQPGSMRLQVQAATANWTPMYAAYYGTTRNFTVYNNGYVRAVSYGFDIAGVTSGASVREDSANGLAFWAGSALKWSITNTGILKPAADNSYALGGASNRASVIYAGTGTINTSDVNEKTEVNELSRSEKRVAKHLKEMIRTFKFKDSVEAKGSDKARLHFGVIAQEVKAAFEAEGLDAFRYGVLCYDTWEAQEATESTPAVEAGSRYGVRYDELFALIVSALYMG